MTYSRSDLLAIVDSLRLAQQARDSMLAETKYTEELRTMAGEVQQIALQMKLLTLNAAIEAARAGEQGKSFGILANEMRKLSAVSNETGVRMATKVEVIAAAISAIAKRSQDSSSHETSSVSRAESSIQDVLKRFENVTVRLTESAADMQKESTEVRNEISDALVLLQFQDRVSQILSHVTQNMDDLCGRLHQFGTQQHSEGEIDLNAWLNEMIGTFSTEEEFRNIQKQPLTSRSTKRPISRNTAMAKTVLVVDDSASLRQVVHIALKTAGYQVIEAEDGHDALNKLDGRKIHLAICDVNMPNMDGITFVKEVKKLDGYRFLPIIMLTTESRENKKLLGQQAGAKAWVVKPFRPEQILAAVSKLIMP